MPATTPQQQPGGRATTPNTATTVLSVAVASRVSTIALMILANALLPTHDAGGVHKFRPRTFPVPAGPGGIDGRDGGALSAFTRWDAAWFLSIADSGYPSPSLSGGGGGSAEASTDCRGTARAWGGEEYERDAGELRREKKEPEKEDQEAGRGARVRDGRGSVTSADRRLPCLPDVPLEEQAHAFFPLYPWLVRWAAAALRALLLTVGFTLGKAGSLVVAAVLVSNTCFVGAVLLLHRLGKVVTGDSLLAYRGALVFCVTPASVFFSTAYTESLYAALTFGGLLVLFSEGERRKIRKIGGGTSSASNDSGAISAAGGGAVRGMRSWLSGAVNSWAAAALLSLATLTRSNGIAGAGVLVLERLRWMAGDAGLFIRADHDHGDGGSAAATHGRRAAPPAATGASPLVTRSRSKKIGSGGGADNDGVSVGGERGGGEATAAAPAAAASRSEACSAWDDAVLCLRLAASLLATALQALLVVAPYILVQAYAYRKFCVSGAVARDDGSYEEGEEGIGGSSAMAEDPLHLHVQRLHPWCAWRVPSVYAHVQSAYWNVGALRYYQWKQIPNFFLAAPALALTAWGTFRFFSAQLRPHLEAPARAGESTGGEGGGGGGPARLLCRLVLVVRFFCPAWLEKVFGVFFGRPRLPRPASPAFERTGAAALMAQWAFFAVFAALCMNVQVATRFLAAACPPLHWWTASLLVGGDGERRRSDEKERAVTTAAAATAAASVKGSDGASGLRTCLRWYLGVYFVVGAVLHASFLPWT